MSDGERVRKFPFAKCEDEISPEERSRRIDVRADQVAAQPEGFWQVILSDAAEQLGIPAVEFETIVVAKRQALQKQTDEERAASRRAEELAEEKRRTESSRFADEQERQRQIDEEERRKQKLKDDGFEQLAKLSGAAREAGLVELASQLGVAPDVLRRELDEHEQPLLGRPKERDLDALVRIGREGAVFFCNAAGQAFADVLIKTTRNTWLLSSAEFNDWLIERFIPRSRKRRARLP